ncbi:hypothetical protein LINPERHAP1_LOCUS36334, partial [Linum perenne]
MLMIMVGWSLIWWFTELEKPLKSSPRCLGEQRISIKRRGPLFASLHKMSNYGWDEPLVDQTPEGARPQPGDCSLLWGENK